MELYFALVVIFLFILVILAFFAGKAMGKRLMFELMQPMIDKERKDAVKRSKAVLTGQISEQLAPYFEEFPGKASESRFIGKPIDFIVFSGLDERNVDEIVFVEVKTGGSKMSAVQKSVRDTIEKKRVRFEEITLK